MATATASLPPKKQFIKLLQENAYSHRPHEVFRDFCAMAALSISNSVDRSQYDAREAEYMTIVGRYTREEVARFPAMLAAVVDALGEGFDDVLGSLFMALDLGSHWHGQFFTPYPIASLMARVTLSDDLQQRDVIEVMEPAIGAGAMVIAMADALYDAKINFQQKMHVTGVDVDITAVHMAYIQLSMLHIPAVVVHGNSLSLETWSHWVTPAHVLGLWDVKLSRHRSERDGAQLIQQVLQPDASLAAEAPAMETAATTSDTDDVHAAPPLAAIRNQIITARTEQLALF